MLKELVAQLNKDMALSGMALEIPAMEDVKMLHQVLSKELYQLMQTDFDRYLNFLYRIDLDQQEAQFGQNQDAKLYAEDIADTIMAALSMKRRALWPELAVFATNPWKED